MKQKASTEIEAKEPEAVKAKKTPRKPKVAKVETETVESSETVEEAKPKKTRTAKAKAKAVSVEPTVDVAELETEEVAPQSTKARRTTRSKKVQEVVEAQPVKPARRRIAKAEKIDYVEYEPAVTIPDDDDDKEEQDGLEDAMEKLERITKSSPFAKYDAMLDDDDDDDDDDDIKVVVPRPVARVSVVATTPTVSNRVPRGKSRKKDGEDEFHIPDESAKIAALNKGNVWSYDVEQIYEMLLEGRHTEHWSENELHFMNIIKPVFDVKFVDRTDDALVASLEEQGFYVNVYPKTRDDVSNAIALRKHKIRKITDLSMENIFHITARDVLDLIEENMGTGWQGLPLPIQDIIESGFYVDFAVMPAVAMHRAGGIIDRRKADGYEVLEVERGTWIEGIFMKYKPRQEKRHFESVSDPTRRQYDGGEEDENDDDDDELIDEDDNDDIDEDDDQMEEQDPQYEDFEEIPDEEDDE